MIKVHSWKPDLHPRGFTKEDMAKLESFTDNITIWYDPGHKNSYEASRFYIDVPEFVARKTGTPRIGDLTAEKVFGRLHEEYQKYIEATISVTRTKIILYTFTMHGARYNDRDCGKSRFRYGGNSCSEQTIQQNLKIEIEWRIRYMATQGNKCWLEKEEGSREGYSFNPNAKDTATQWMYWTPEREAFFVKLSEGMLDLIGMIHDFFGQSSMGSTPMLGSEVAHKIDAGQFPMLEAGKGEKS